MLRALQRGRVGDAQWKLLHRYLIRDIERSPLEYVSFLEEIEEGLYDAEGRLVEDRLIERVRRDPRWTFQAGNRAIRSLGRSALELPVPGARNITCLPPNLGSGDGARDGAGLDAAGMRRGLDPV